MKSHKSADMLKIQMEYGISKFKTATVAEAEMAEAGASHVILAYPLVGPNQERLVRLAMAYPDTCFYAVEDDREQLKKLADLCLEMNYEMKVLIDVNMGMNRTGVSIDDMEKLYRYGNSLEGLVDGLHCYDGNHNNKDIIKWTEDVKETDDKIKEVIGNLQTDGIPCENHSSRRYTVISMPCRTDRLVSFTRYFYYRCRILSKFAGSSLLCQELQ